MATTTTNKKKKKPATKKKMGCKGKYHKWITKKGLEIITGWKRNGLTDEQVAKNIGVRRETIYDWARRFEHFSNAIKSGRESADLQVENAMFKRAIGFKETLKKPMKIRQSNGAETVVSVEEEVYYPPNTAAIVFWLKNRKSEVWRNDDRVVVENNEDAINIHQKPIAALQNRKVKGFNDSEGKSNG